MNKPIWVLACLAVMLFACTHEPLENYLDGDLRSQLDFISPTGSHTYYSFPSSDDYAAIPNQDSKNPITAEKVELGKLLFHESALAAAPAYPVGSGTFSCASCHIAAAGFTPGRLQGLADGGLGFGENRQKVSAYLDDEVDAQGARPLSVLNVAYVTNALWSGAFGSYGVNAGTQHLWEDHTLGEVNALELEGLEAQNIEGLTLHRMEVTPELLDVYGYRAYFDAAFPDFEETERYNKTTVSFALAAYLRTLYAQQAPFQQWLSGATEQMTNQEKRGALLFIGKARCTNCHKSPSFNSMEFHALGTPDLFQHADALNTGQDDPRNLGRAFYTNDQADAYKYKVPQLYNLKDYSHFFHGSSRTSVADVIRYKINAQSHHPNVSNEDLSQYFQPLDLSAEEIEDLTAFLTNGLHDPNLDRYVPTEVLSGNCIPNNDYFSRIDLGCE